MFLIRFHILCYTFCEIKICSIDDVFFSHWMESYKKIERKYSKCNYVKNN